jgi:DNA-binding response OmpR family regulator
MTGHRGVGGIDHPAGIAGWLEKPFSIDEVVAALDRVVVPA